MGFFKQLGAFMKMFGRGGYGQMDDVEAEILFAELQSKISELMPFAEKADESYHLLKYNNLVRVPAIDLYDGSYVDRLLEIEMAGDSDNAMKVQRQLDKIPSVATQIQTYLNEETSDLEAAKLWDSKFIKGVNDHIPPHYKKGEYMDDTMSMVMEAFRNWSSFAQNVIDMYGSQRLINATYEAVLEGEDAMSYMSEILDLDQQNSGFGGGLHEPISVPYAGFFGGGFFF